MEWIASLEILGMRFGLDRMRRLLDVLGHPQLRAPAIHVVGTNGKTSTTLVAARALSAAGLRVGAYLSPHVTTWSERIQVGGGPVSEAALERGAARVRAAAQRLGLGPGDGVTQFEALTATAFCAFADAGVEAVVVEAGLGGRFDATNVLPRHPVGTVLRARPVTVLTNISLEHTELLGDTEALIAAEKLAVAPDGDDRLIVGRLTLPARAGVCAEIARRRLSGWWLDEQIAITADDGDLTISTPFGAHPALRIDSPGRFQEANVAVGVAAAERLLDRGLDTDALREALAGLRIPGRLELVPGTPPILLDGAHNPAGMQVLAAEIPRFRAGGPVVAVVSLLDDKDAGGMLAPLAAACDALVATRSPHARAVAPEEIARVVAALGRPATVCAEPAQALRAACTQAGPEGLVLVCGSLYLLAALNAAWPDGLAHPTGGEVRDRTARS